MLRSTIFSRLVMDTWLQASYNEWHVSRVFLRSGSSRWRQITVRIYEKNRNMLSRYSWKKRQVSMKIPYFEWQPKNVGFSRHGLTSLTWFFRNWRSIWVVIVSTFYLNKKREKIKDENQFASKDIRQNSTNEIARFARSCKILQNLNFLRHSVLFCYWCKISAYQNSSVWFCYQSVVRQLSLIVISEFLLKSEH